MLQFDAATARLLEISYRGADVTRRRRAVFDAVQPGPGERIVDIGCGHGFLAAELARAVGEQGQVIGVDPSEDMRGPASERCAEFSWVEIRDGLADALPLPDGSVDKALSLQVFEYLSDIPAAVTEARRVLAPGGRLVVGDAHWDTLSWHSDDPERMARMTAAWDRHLTELRVPAILPGLLRDAGFLVEHVEPLTFSDTELRPDGLANMIIHLILSYVLRNELVPEAEAQAWADEQKALARAGRFFFTLTYFVISARRT